MTGLGTYFKQAKPSVYRIAYVYCPVYVGCPLTPTVSARMPESECLALESTPSWARSNSRILLPMMRLRKLAPQTPTPCPWISPDKALFVVHHQALP